MRFRVCELSVAAPRRFNDCSACCFPFIVYLANKDNTFACVHGIHMVLDRKFTGQLLVAGVSFARFRSKCSTPR